MIEVRRIKDQSNFNNNEHSRVCECNATTPNAPPQTHLEPLFGEPNRGKKSEDLLLQLLVRLLARVRPPGQRVHKSDSRRFLELVRQRLVQVRRHFGQQLFDAVLKLGFLAKLFLELLQGEELQLGPSGGLRRLLVLRIGGRLRLATTSVLHFGTLRLCLAPLGASPGLAARGLLAAVLLPVLRGRLRVFDLPGRQLVLESASGHRLIRLGRHQLLQARRDPRQELLADHDRVAEDEAAGGALGAAAGGQVLRPASAQRQMEQVGANFAGENGRQKRLQQKKKESGGLLIKNIFF